jgi:hypothetical protein
LMASKNTSTRFGLYVRNYSLFNRDEYYYQQYINDTKRI